jgi:3',5'-cyclic AMP phosphodiesterase CpdA
MSDSIPKVRKTRIVCISDTHNQTPKLPCGDVLIHTGDLTNQGSYSELQKTVAWLEKADFEAKIVVAGPSTSPLLCMPLTLG